LQAQTKSAEMEAEEAGNLLHTHGIMEWVGWEGTFRGHPVQPPAMSRDIFHQPRLLRAPSNLALSVSRVGASTTSLGNLCQCFTTLVVKKFFLISILSKPTLP